MEQTFQLSYMVGQISKAENAFLLSYYGMWGVTGNRFPISYNPRSNWRGDIERQMLAATADHLATEEATHKAAESRKDVLVHKQTLVRPLAHAASSLQLETIERRAYNRSILVDQFFLSEKSRQVGHAERLIISVKQPYRVHLKELRIVDRITARARFEQQVLAETVKHVAAAVPQHALGDRLGYKATAKPLFGLAVNIPHIGITPHYVLAGQEKSIGILMDQMQIGDDSERIAHVMKKVDLASKYKRKATHFALGLTGETPAHKAVLFNSYLLETPAHRSHLWSGTLAGTPEHVGHIITPKDNFAVRPPKHGRKDLYAPTAHFPIHQGLESTAIEMVVRLLRPGREEHDILEMDHSLRPSLHVEDRSDRTVVKAPKPSVGFDTEIIPFVKAPHITVIERTVILANRRFIDVIAEDRPMLGGSKIRQGALEIQMLSHIETVYRQAFVNEAVTGTVSRDSRGAEVHSQISTDKKHHDIEVARLANASASVRHGEKSEIVTADSSLHGAEVTALLKDGAVKSEAYVDKLLAVYSLTSVPRPALNEFMDTQGDINDEYTQIWNTIFDHDDRKDLMIVPSRDFDYASNVSKLMDENGVPYNPIGDPSFPDVQVYYPVTHPFPEWAEIGNKEVWVSLTHLKEGILRLIEIWRFAKLKLAGMTLLQGLNYLLEQYMDYLKQMGDLVTIERYRVFRLVRWYAERHATLNSAILLHREYEQWNDLLREGSLNTDGTYDGFMMDTSTGVLQSVSPYGEVNLSVTNYVQGDFSMSAAIPSGTEDTTLTIMIDDEIKRILNVGAMLRMKFTLPPGTHEVKIIWDGQGGQAIMSGFVLTGAVFVGATSSFTDPQELQGNLAIHKLIGDLMKYYHDHWDQAKNKGSAGIRQRKPWLTT